MGRERQLKRIQLLHELGMGMDDVYTREEALLACREEIFSRAWDMDTGFLLEALRALDDRPRKSACPHMEQNERRLMRAIEAEKRHSARKLAVLIATAALLLALCLTLAACCAQADLLTFWKIPEETARAAHVLTPHAVDGTLTWPGRADENGALPHGWLAVLDEVYYDGVTAYVYYTIREVNGEKAIGTRDEETGCILLTDEDEHYIANRGVGGNQDSLLVNGRKIDMLLTGMDSRGSTLPGLTNHYMEIEAIYHGTVTFLNRGLSDSPSACLTTPFEPPNARTENGLISDAR